MGGWVAGWVALEEWKLKLTSAKVEVEVEAELGKKSKIHDGYEHLVVQCTIGCSNSDKAWVEVLTSPFTNFLVCHKVCSKDCFSKGAYC